MWQRLHKHIVVSAFLKLWICFVSFARTDPTWKTVSNRTTQRLLSCHTASRKMISFFLFLMFNSKNLVSVTLSMDLEDIENKKNELKKIQAGERFYTSKTCKWLQSCGWYKPDSCSAFGCEGHSITFFSCTSWTTTCTCTRTRRHTPLIYTQIHICLLS